MADISRLHDLLGYAPQVDLPTGIGRFARWAAGEALPEDRVDQANAELRERGLMG